ncbi:MAG TPA: imidazoleglycerol-phosphate dehydratase HisB [Candidatus Dormibacteraeota bacterium]|nr:imidazoleglycerol-phosphate dehydratase HisB [Candidatus Dormibacteraeota bacterium]
MPRQIGFQTRDAEVERNTRETQLKARLSLDGAGETRIDVGVPFLDHMLEQTARFAGFALELAGKGDLEVDDHHLTEDAGIVFGQALSRALGERDGIRRFGAAYAPLDEALARVVVDLCQRPYCEVDDNGKLGGKAGTYATENLHEFFRAFSIHAGATLHVDCIRGRDRHHVAESMFKALGLALREAVTVVGAGVPSTKGEL